MDPDARRQQIEAGLNDPGATGAFMRLCKRADFMEVRHWFAGERIRGTPPETLAEAVGQSVALLVYYYVIFFPPEEVRARARKIFENAVKIFDDDISVLLDAAAGRRSALRVQPGDD